MMNESWRERQVYRLLVLAALMVLWALVVTLTGGFVLSIAGMRLSSRSMRNALIVFSVATAGAWAIAPRGRRMQALSDAWTRLASTVDASVIGHPRLLSRTSYVLVLVIASAVTLTGVTRGALVVGGADSYGYVSQAHLWATGTLRVQPPFGEDRPAGLSNATFAPLGYRLSGDERFIVPTYPPGFPMLASLFERAGGPDAVFYVMPLMAGITVFATYLLGIAVSGRAVGLLAALLMALSPPFLFQLTHAPMSDIVAACWWTLALVLLPHARGSYFASLLMGVCAAAAILTRANLVPLAIVPAGWLLWHVMKNPARGQAIVRLALYSIGPVAASLVVAGLNRYWYGSPTESGYGELAGELFQWGFLWPNIVHYSRSIVQTHTLAIVLALLAPLFVRNALVTTYALFALVMYLCYAVYLPMEAWWALRFFLPGFPIILVFLSVTIVHGTRLIPLGPRVLWPVVITVLIVVQMREFIRDMKVLDSTVEHRFAQIGRYIADVLPGDAVVFALMHSGSANFYSGRVTVRFDYLPPGRFTAVAREFQRRGHPVFILLDTFEEEDFAKRFGPADRFGMLDPRAAKLVPNVWLYQVNQADVAP